MTEQRCVKTELPVSMCAHCKGLDDVVDLTEDYRLDAVFRSRYTSVCSIDSEHRIAKGDQIAKITRTDNPFLGVLLYACPRCTAKLLKRKQAPA